MIIFLIIIWLLKCQNIASIFPITQGWLSKFLVLLGFNPKLNNIQFTKIFDKEKVVWV